jgi:hypothetical protein
VGADIHRSAHLESYFRSDEAGMCCRKDCRQVLEESGEITVVVFIEIKRRRSRIALHMANRVARGVQRADLERICIYKTAPTSHTSPHVCSPLH